MQTSLARRRRLRRAIARRPGGRAATTAVTVLGAAAGTFVATSVFAGFIGLLVLVGGYNHFSQGLPEPVAALAGIEFEQQTILYDRTGKIELARLGELKRELIVFDDIPAEVLDATTAIEDKDFWTNPGFDLSAIVSAGIDTVTGRPRGASTITQQLVRSRLLPPEAFAGSTFDRKIREIIQSIRLTEAFPGEAGKEQIITAYLNQNFYGNQSYGIKAAAKSYFGKTLDELSLAQAAILAAIPQSPTRFDLVRNAQSICLEDLPDDVECAKFTLIVPPQAEIVQRRNFALELMKTRSPLSGDAHTAAEYEAAKDEPVELRQQVSAKWKAPHLVWQVREELGRILCPDTPDDCQAVDSGGYRVTTTLDWEMQQVAEKWVFAAARATNAKDPVAVLTSRKIPEAAHKWILGLRGHDIHNAAAAIQDYRTGEILAYVGSASYTSRGTKTFQPQYDVLADGWRQPGSAIKPINYAIGIDDRAITASTMLMDVATDFGNEATPWVPTQADKLERGPVRVRSALQFSLNVPAIKATMITGLERVLGRTLDFGLTYPATALPVASMGIGTLELHPIELLGAYSVLANGGVRAPQKMIVSIVDADGRTVWPLSGLVEKGTRVINAGSAYIVTDILAGNTDRKVNPYWGKWAIFEGDTRRPAAYKTGTTSDNRDVAAYGYLAPPEDDTSPALAVGVWMGNSDNTPNDGKLSLDTSAPLWSAILTEISQGLPIADFVAPENLETAEVDAFTGFKPGPFTRVTVEEIFLPGTVPTQEETSRVALGIDEASGLLWQDGCAGPMITTGFFDLAAVDVNFPTWQLANAEWSARAAEGPGTGRVVGDPNAEDGPVRTRTSYFYNNSFAPYGKTWGAPFPPLELCPIVEVICDPFAPDPADPFATPTPVDPFASPNPADPFATPTPRPTCAPPPVVDPGVDPPPLDGLVPILQCMTLEEAADALTVAGLAIGDVQPNDPGGDFVVSDSVPSAGTPISPGSSVALTLRSRPSVASCP